ncbi:MAG: bifunctional phosphoglucose/phosphomannose isomerase [Acidimicrobiales bacterium]
MTTLPPAGEVLDTLGMREVTFGLPEQVAAASSLAAGLDGLPRREAVENVVVLGMGGSGIAGDVVAAVAGPFMPVPVVVAKGYECPSFVGDGTLCFAISFSGNTEETVEAATAAAAAGARMVVLAGGGRLGELAAAWDAPFVRMPHDIPMPRAAIGAVSVPPLIVLEQIGLFPGASGWIDEAVAQLSRRRAELAKDDNAARAVARSIGRTLPLIYGGGELGLVAAARWKNQVNENAKVAAFAHVIPELTHNEVCGWGQHGDVTRQVFTLVLLRHDHEHPQVGRRFELVRELVEEVVAGVEEVRAEGEGALAQLFDLVLFGDVVSLHLAFQEGVDPGPVPVLDDIKRRLASPDLP